MDDLVGPPLAITATRDAWILSIDGWPLLCMDAAGVAVNDLRQSLLFGHQVWFERRAATDAVPEILTASSARSARIALDGSPVAAVSLDPSRPTHADVEVFDPHSGRRLFDREVRYCQLAPSLEGRGPCR